MPATYVPAARLPYGSPEACRAHRAACKVRGKRSGCLRGGWPLPRGHHQGAARVGAPAPGLVRAVRRALAHFTGRGRGLRGGGQPAHHAELRGWRRGWRGRRGLRPHRPHRHSRQLRVDGPRGRRPAAARAHIWHRSCNARRQPQRAGGAGRAGRRPTCGFLGARRR